MIKAVLFDLDGTLANSIDDLADSVNFLLAANGYPTHPTEAFRYFVGDGILKMLERALPEQSRDPDTIRNIRAAFKNRYEEHYCDKTACYDGVQELILELKTRGIKIAVVTNKAQEMAQLVVEKLYGDAFDVICGQQNGVPNKPDPALAFIAMDKLSVKPQECIFMGDSGMDVACAVNSGAYPVGVIWGYRDADELLSAGAAVLIHKPSELLKLI